MHAASARPGARVLRDGRLGAAALVRSPTSPCSASTATGSCRASTSGTPAGGRRSSTPSTSRCASGPASSTCRRSRSSTSSGPRRSHAVQRTVVAQVDVAAGRVVYTPVLDAQGGFRSDLTVMRLAHDRFRVVTGGAHGMADLKWFADHAARPRRRGRRPDLGVHHDRAVGPAGPRHPRPRSPTPTSATRVSRSAPAGDIEVGSLDVLASRISYVGELGWELYVPMEQGARLWDLLHEAGEPARRGAGRDRRLRHDRAAGEGLPGLRLRARRRAHASSRPACSGRRSRPPTSSGREAYLAQREAAPRTGAVHADRRRPHLGRRR